MGFNPMRVATNRLATKTATLVTRLGILVLVALGCGCATVVSSVTNQLANDLADTVLANPDKEVVASGLPAYLLLVDALVEGSPENAALLRTSALLNGSYASAFIADENRQKQFTTKAKTLALEATCAFRSDLCGLDALNYEDFVAKLSDSAAEDIAYLYVLGTSWAGWIQAHSDDFFALAQLPKAKLLIERVLELDAGYADGSPHLYLGVFALTLPAALGGQPELGREQFERAITLSNGSNLYAKVLLAEMYARSQFDRELHDQLVDEVISANPVADQLTLQNVVAQEIAIQLKESADEFF